MFGYIYKITNKLNNGVYIGKRECDHLDESYWGSGVWLWNAINKYGKENFSREIIDWAIDKEDITNKERFWIAFAREHYELCYNIADGGQGGAIQNKKELFPEWCLKASRTYKAKFEDPEYATWRKQNAKKIYSNKTRIHKDGKIKDVDNGLLEGYLNDGWKLGLGTRSKETGKSISNGKKNCVCINKDGSNKYVKPEDLPRYIEQGYNVGYDNSNVHYNKQDKVCINKDGHIRYVNNDILDTYLEKGWTVGGIPNSNMGQGTKDKKYMTDGIINILVNTNEIDSYLEKGYRLGLTRKKKN